MTIDDLDNFRGMQAELKAIQSEIDSLYNPVCCPNGQTGGGHSSTPSAPTERAVERILALKDKLSCMQDDIAKEIEDIETWVASIDDAEIRSIIRWHYLVGDSWKVTNIKVYGYPCRYACRKKLMRFMGAEK
jgi:hypothetical protein